jgi:hypothetical protein
LSISSSGSRYSGTTTGHEVEAVRLDEPQSGGVHLYDAGIRAEQFHAGGLGLEDRAQFPFAGLEFPASAAQLELRHRLAGEDLERLLLRWRQGARNAIHHAHRAQDHAFRGGQRRARIKADARRAGHQRVLREARILGQIRHDEHLARTLELKCAKSLVAGSRVDVETDFRLEPLPPLVEQGDHRHRGGANSRRERGKVIERILGRGIEHAITPQDFKPVCFCLGFVCTGHPPPPEGERTPL